MEHQNLSLVWKSFIEAARVGTGRHGSRNHKVQASRTALNLSDQLVTNNYNTGDLYKTWLENIKKVTAFLEADLVMIKRTVRDHFSILHSGDQADFFIDFTEKTGGMSVGIIADIDFCGMASRFYIKSHQRGPRPSSISVANRYVSMKPPFIQEMYFFSDYILSLEDVLTNSGNYGQNSQGQPAVIDFWFNDRDNYLFTDEQVSNFWNDSVLSHSRFISEGVQNIQRERKKQIIRSSVEEWNLFEIINEAKITVEQFISKNNEKLEVSGDLDGYVAFLSCRMTSSLVDGLSRSWVR